MIVARTPSRRSPGHISSEDAPNPDLDALLAPFAGLRPAEELRLLLAAEFKFADGARRLYLHRLRSIGRRRKEAFLRQAFRFVPFYAALGATHRHVTVDVHPRGAAQALLRAGFMIDRELLSRCLPSFLSSRFRAEHGLTEKTSGTSGAPLSVPHDPASWYEINYQGLSFVPLVASVLSRSARPFRPGIVLISNKPIRDHSVLALPDARFALYVRLMLGKGQAVDERVISLMAKTAFPVLHGKPAYLRHLADLADDPANNRGKNNRPIRPEIIVSAGEAVYDDDLARFQDAFGSHVINLYSSVEGGLIAFGTGRAESMTIFDQLCDVLVLTANGVLQDCGEGELVVTNYMNWAFPIINYRTGDYAEVARSGKSLHGQKIIRRLFGRNKEYRGFGDLRVERGAIEAIFYRYRVWDFRIESRQGEVTVLWSCPFDSRFTNTTAARLDAELRTCLTEHGREPRVIREGQITPFGGKRVRFVVS